MDNLELNTIEMAKKEQLKDNKTVVDALFLHYPKLDLYYQTADGTAFFTYEAAFLYVEKMDDKTIKKVTR
jgi:hypothetical protein